MQAEYYSDISIAVFGDTKPWATNFKALGGKFNGNLKGRPGWVFRRAKEGELMQFIANANAGLIQPTPQTVASPVAQPTMVPQGFMQPAMTPQAAMARLTVAQPGLPVIQPIVQAPGATQFGLTMAVPKPLSPPVPKPFIPLPAQPAVVNYPNLFTAGDGLTYQVVIYTVPVPHVGQHVTLSIGENNIEYEVTSMEKTSPPYDSIIITRVPMEDAPAEEEAIASRAIIMNGQWKIHCMQDEHHLIFHPMTQ